MIGIATVTVAGAAALAAPAMSAMAATGTNPTTTVINLPTLNTEPSGPVMVPFTVTDDVAGGPAPTGTVTITAPVLPDQPVAPANFTPCTGDLTPGADGTSTGECEVATTVGSWGFVLMQANYSGDDNNAVSGTGDAEYKIINLMPTATAVSPATATAGKAVTLTATVLPADQAAASAHTADGNLLAAFSETGGDTVAFTANGVAIPGCGAVALLWNATLLENYVQCSYTPPAAGTDAIVAVFSGDEYAATSTSPTDDLAATSVTTTTVSGASGYVDSGIWLSAKVAGTSTPTGTVKFEENGKTLCSGTLSNGAARCEHWFPAVGSVTVEAVYEGDATQATSDGSATVKVAALHTSVKVTASPASATKGKAVRFAVTVTSAASAAAGTVTFYVNGHKVGTATVSGGKASYSYTWHATGTYTVTAVYSGNATHLGSKGAVSVKVAS